MSQLLDGAQSIHALTENSSVNIEKINLGVDISVL
jgi:hypothetical protein